MKRYAAVFAVCLLAAAGCSKSPEQQAVELIEQLGGKVSLENGQVVAVDLRDSQAQDGALSAIQYLPHVHTVNCTNVAAINGSGLTSLGGLPQLHTLYLVGTGLDDAGLAHVKQLHALRTLHAGGTKITDSGLAALSDLKNLRTLVLSDTAITDNGLVHLRDLRDLSTLILRNTQVTPNGIRDLRRSVPNARITR
jgi:hypothetical protein